MILVIDNFDSFTFNLVQYLRRIGMEASVRRNDEVTTEDVRKMAPEAILISPGPGNPDSSGVCLELVRRFHKEIPILGICLGQQVIARAFGGTVGKGNCPVHGKTSPITHDGCGVFTGLPSPLRVARYHSLVVEEKTLPDCLEVSARTAGGEIMAIRHKVFQVEGVQFHPEAILTERGLDMLRNFFLRVSRPEVIRHA
ncbi:Para-aminobenzoate synthase glutamine amidotransferase component II [Bhargavaea cecembensis DSE10]|uniref:Para-aminobenzoate synthase glutamine amidotransferase component II n=1 Tax=Bhargavaea cecembensis DSE10 TaxID=1235279 RepID=M7NFJ9_9BACL|nr:aminodeoxychorismate/anthranilate synthase component II [Bhargavaea cecembensis]EMR05976.1 Para-aminobenzoate synthase glutamine amidotransferase component II [Bhargavaea cecembensis DSE10]